MVELFQGTFDLTIETVALETDISERLVVIDIWGFFVVSSTLVIYAGLKFLKRRPLFTSCMYLSFRSKRRRKKNLAKARLTLTDETE